MASCPECGVLSQRVHSRYERVLHDLPWQGRPVALRVQARRFRCLNPPCLRQTFSERLADVATAARRTERLGDLQRHLGLALGGEAGMRLADRLAMPTSADTLLRLVCKAGSAAEPPSAPRVVAVDDWAWRRGRRYGTILVDLKRNEVIDLLPDRQAESLAGWLRRHPGVEVVARGRERRVRSRSRIAGTCCAISATLSGPSSIASTPPSGELPSMSASRWLG